ncbi:putative ferulic acid Esterase/Feruloyl esterase [Polychaeton citri CBS 116435]|uniref:Carboxylic ester hydrolase n=1 Tax=Polychaeton citri CBS 116435 TaxID=1314669 RepID=A0A9P4Q2H4_9PEZI|nr:putative ferulic acid Esterase/Feruloyl esterase [Polychaeton citri CBS 116435]
MGYMKLLALGFTLATSVFSLHCSPSVFQSILPSNAWVTFAYELSQNATFHVPTTNIAYPVSPTSLRKSCVVEVKVASSAASSFSFGLFLPQEWNQRFLMVGNGGFAGGINWMDMGAGLGYGFAVVSTNTGHNSTALDVTWALNQPQMKIDFGYRAVHGSARLARSLIQHWYGQAPNFSYYSGCSTGGRQGLIEAQMFPEDFDGILVGAAAWWTSHLHPWTLKLGLLNLPTTAPHHIPVNLFATIEAEVNKQCDPQDGVVDGIISDPLGCVFNAAALLCKDNLQQQGKKNDTWCLSKAQLQTLSKIYSPYYETNSTFVFPGLLLGSEALWHYFLGESEPTSLGTQYIQDMVLDKPGWNFYDFNFSVVELAEKLDPGNCTADNYDLSPFQKRGGKLLMYHGLADGQVPVTSSTYFHKKVQEALVPKSINVNHFFRLFLIPGMQHCAGASNAPWYIAGPNQAGLLDTSLHSVPGFCDAKHDALVALMNWVEHDHAPEAIIATKWHNDTLRDRVFRQRPICPYPQQAKYIGHGDLNEASNWKCQGHARFYDQS